MDSAAHFTHSTSASCASKCQRAVRFLRWWRVPEWANDGVSSDEQNEQDDAARQGDEDDEQNRDDATADEKGRPDRTMRARQPPGWMADYHHIDWTAQLCSFLFGCLLSSFCVAWLSASLVRLGEGGCKSRFVNVLGTAFWHCFCTRHDYLIWRFEFSKRLILGVTRTRKNCDLNSSARRLESSAHS